MSSSSPTAVYHRQPFSHNNSEGETDHLQQPPPPPPPPQNPYSYHDDNYDDGDDDDAHEHLHLPWYDAFDAIRPPLTHVCLPSCVIGNDDCGCASWLCGSLGCCCCCCSTMDNSALGYAFDIILIQSHTDPSRVECSDLQYSFDSLLGVPPFWRVAVPSYACCKRPAASFQTYLEVEHCDLRFPVTPLGKLRYPTITTKTSSSSNLNNAPSAYQHEEDGMIGDPIPPRSHEHDPRVLQLLAQHCHQQQQQQQQSSSGGDDQCGIRARMVVVEESIHHGRRRRIRRGVAPCFIHMWSTCDRIVVCDIDGTVTKSNLRGLWDSVVIGQHYQFCHAGICEFLQGLVTAPQPYNDVEDGDASLPNNIHSHCRRIRILYLTSRPLGLAHSTRRLLQNLQQPTTNTHPTMGTTTSRLPRGPLLGFPGPLRKILLMELLYHNVHEFKATALRSIVDMWNRVQQGSSSTSSSSITPTQQHSSNPFLVGIGNTFMDAQAYHVGGGMDLQQIYIINKASGIVCLDRRHNGSTSGGGSKKAKVVVVDYPAAKRTLFPLGYRDKNLQRHMLEPKQPEEEGAAVGEWSLV